jgi:hypothetical protein
MLDEIASLARIDLAPRHRQPLTGRVLLATAAAIGGSLAADAILVAVGEAVFPGTKGYVHFRFADYAKLTVIGRHHRLRRVADRHAGVVGAAVAIHPPGCLGHAGIVAA